VRDEQYRHTALAAALLDQTQDLRLGRHVERRRRLVGDEELGAGRDRDRDHHALAHAARELVRVGPEALLGTGDVDAL
jgi:hypothetical protein